MKIHAEIGNHLINLPQVSHKNRHQIDALNVELSNTLCCCLPYDSDQFD